MTPTRLQTGKGVGGDLARVWGVIGSLAFLPVIMPNIIRVLLVELVFRHHLQTEDSK
jgi:hypothetical protein